MLLTQGTLSLHGQHSDTLDVHFLTCMFLENKSTALYVRKRRALCLKSLSALTSYRKRYAWKIQPGSRLDAQPLLQTLHGDAHPHFTSPPWMHFVGGIWEPQALLAGR